MNKSTVEEIRERFDNDVERFSDLSIGTPAQIDSVVCLDLIADAATLVPGANSLLDVGCGAGNYALKILERLPRLDITLIDLSAPMLARAEQRVSQATTGVVRTMQGDIRELELGREQYDIVVAAAVLHHLRDESEWRAVFTKFYEAIKPKGALLIYDLVQQSSPDVERMTMRRYGEYLSGLGGSARQDVLGWIEQEDTPRPLVYQLDLLRAVGFQSTDVLHKNGPFAAFGAFKSFQETRLPMAAYVIVDIIITDPAGYHEYTNLSGPSVMQYGGRFLVRGGAHEVLEGDRPPGRLVLLEFESADAARRWWNSPEYEAAKVVRRAASTARFVLVEGV